MTDPSSSPATDLSSGSATDLTSGPTTGLAYVQHPSIRGERVVFSAEGDLWEVPLSGGVARRLTSSSGTHSFPRISPDGRWIAFSSADEGPAAIWVMPAEGGPARRLTFGPTPDFVTGWSPDSARIVFRTSWRQGFRAQSLASVPASGGAVRSEPFGRASAAAYHPDGDRIVVNRHTTDPAWWKRYAGGRAGRLWIGSLSTGEFTKVPGGPRTDANPMWIGDEIWFLSDDDGMGDIWRCDADGSNRRRVTAHADFYGRWPQADGTRIVYSCGGRLMLLDTALFNTGLANTGADEPTPVEIPVRALGHSIAKRRKFTDVPRGVKTYALNADGSEALFTVRGHVVRLPNWHGAARIVAGATGVRFRGAQWLGDTGRIAAIAHVEGEDRIAILPEDGIGRDLARATVLPGVGRRIRSLVPSPDGKRLAVLDGGRSIHVISFDDDGAETDRTVVDDQSRLWVRSASWSPCSTWLAFTRSLTWWMSRILLWDSRDGATHPVSGAEFSDHSPAWDPAGRFLAFLSSRHLNPYHSEIEHDFVFTAATRPYVAMLRPGEVPPFAAYADVPKEPPERATEPLEIDVAGLAARVVPLPFEPGRYEAVGCSRSGVAVLSAPVVGAMETSRPDWDGPDKARYTVLSYGYRDRKVDTAFKAASGWAESADGSTWLVRVGLKYRVVKAAGKPDDPPPFVPGDHSRPAPATGWIDLGRIALPVEPKAEFRQIVHEAWALQRDHFYDPDLVKIDWEACLERYLPLLERIRTREELTDLLWELQGELGTSHAYAMGGDVARAERYSTGQLGCDFEQDATTGAYRVARVYAGDVWDESRRSPLVVPGSEVPEGSWLLAVDGRSVGGETHPGECLLQTAGKPVTLTVADDAAGANARDVVVVPAAEDWYLRYRAWVDGNREQVAAADSRVGYTHIPNMSLEGAVEFHRNFLWQVPSKKAWVIDARYNGGGNISGILLAKLARKIVGWTHSRYGTPRTYPNDAPRGPIVVLTNENAGSDGDIFSQAVKSVGLGPLIGMRTWGGVVGIDMSKDLVDGGLTSQPEYAFWFPETGWSVENHGVEPDIVVDRTPGDAFHDRDPQLERAISEVLERLSAMPEVPPDPGPRPDLSWPREL